MKTFEIELIEKILQRIYKKHGLEAVQESMKKRKLDKYFEEGRCPIHGNKIEE